MKLKGSLHILVLIASFLLLQLTLTERSNAASDPVVFFDGPVLSCEVQALDSHTIVIGYAEGTDVNFVIYDTNGTVVVAETNVDTDVGPHLLHGVAVAVFNSTTFAIAYYNNGVCSFKVYNSAGSLLVSEVVVASNLGLFRQVYAKPFNGTHFVIAYENAIASPYPNLFAVYMANGTQVIAQTEYSTMYGTEREIGLACLNATHFIVSWYYGKAGAQRRYFRCYEANGTLVTDTIEFQTSSAGTSSSQHQVTAINSTHVVFCWNVLMGSTYPAYYCIYMSNGTQVLGMTNFESGTCYNGPHTFGCALNETLIAGVFQDFSDGGYDYEFAVGNTSGSIVVSETKIETWPTISEIFSSAWVYSFDSVIGISLYGEKSGYWVAAYRNDTTNGVWRSYKPDGTVWDGSVPSGDAISPVYDDATLGKNTSNGEWLCLFYVNCSDAGGLSFFALNHNSSGSYANETFTSFGADTWANDTLTLPAVDIVLSWKLIFNDTNDNWNTTMPYQNFTCTFYTSITINTGTYGWSITPGQSNVTITEGTISLTITANANFDVEMKSWNASLSDGTNTIALTNLLMHKDTLATAIAVTTDYQDIPGLTNQSKGTDIAKSFVLWLSCPTGKPAGSYGYVGSIQVTQA